MRVFMGEFAHTIDPQRRLAIPKHWRGTDEEPAEFFLVPGPNQTIHMLTPERFAKFYRRAEEMSFANPKMADALGLIGATMHQCTCDRQGRIGLTAKLMEHAHLTDEVVLVGAITAIHLHHPGLWKQREVPISTVLDTIQAIEEGGTSAGGR